MDIIEGRAFAAGTYPLRILLLGPPEVYWEHQLLNITRRIPRAILYYLASRGRSVSRAELISFLGLPADHPDTRQRLREQISRLRAQLPQSDLLFVDADRVGLDFNRTWVDQLEFETHLQKIGDLSKLASNDKLLPGPLYTQLSDLMALWRGPAFLAGVELPGSLTSEDWFNENFHALERQCCQTIERLVWHEINARNYPQAMSLARQGLATNQYQEQLHSAVMNILIELGQNGEARQYFHTTSALFENELGLPPPQNMLHLLERLEAGPKSTQLSIYDSGSTTNWQTPFVAREDALDQIQAITQKHQGVFILGLAGEGKTRLIQEYLEQRQPTARQVFAQGSLLDRSLPYQPLCDALRRSVQPQEWQALSQKWARQLSLLVPDISDFRPDLPIDNQSDYIDETTLLEALRQIFLVMAKQSPLILVIDDLQWVDEASLVAITYLLKEPPFNQQASFLAAIRSEEMTAELSDLMIAARTGRFGQTIKLARLQQQDIAVLAKFILGRSPSPEFLNQLTELSAGNPLLVIEILQSHYASKGQSDELRKNLTISATIERLLHYRLQNLEPTSQQILATAAVMGTTFNASILAQACQMETPRVLWILDQLALTRLIYPESAQTSQQYRFRHDKIREAISGMQTSGQNQALHLRVAQAWENHKPPAEAAILATHYELGGAALKAYHYWVKAGQYARQLFAFQDANRAYQHALRLLREIKDNLSDLEIYRLYADWSQQTYEINDTDLNRSLGENLVELGKERRSPLLIGTGFDILSDSCMSQNQFEEGQAYANQAIYFLEQTNQQLELAEAYLRRGVFHYMLNDIAAAVQDLEHALAISSAQQSPEVLRARSNVHFQLALLCTLQCQPQAGLRHALRGLIDAHASQRFYLVISSQVIAATACTFLGKYQSGLQYALAGIALAQQSRGVRMLGYAFSAAAVAEISLGKLDLAFEHAMETIKIGEQTQQNDLVALGCRQIGEIYRLLHDHESALTYYQRGFESIPQHFLGLDNAVRMALINGLAINHDLGRQQIQFTKSIFEQFKVQLGVLVASISEMIIDLESNSEGDRSTAIQELLAQTTRQQLVHHGAILEILWAKAAWQTGERETATERFQTALATAQQLKNPWHQLAALQGLIQTRNQSHPASSDLQEQIETITAQLAAQTRRVELQVAFKSFCERLNAGENLISFNL